MRRALRLLPFLPVILAAALWIRSYWQFDYAVARRWMLNSESGSIYLYYGAGDSAYFVTGSAKGGGRFETLTGGTYRPWLPVRTWNYAGQRAWAVGWWTVTAVCAAPAWWTWRQRRIAGTRGFEVQDAPPNTAPSQRVNEF